MKQYEEVKIKLEIFDLEEELKTLQARANEIVARTATLRAALSGNLKTGI